jgi:hypothetical protein
MMAETAVVEVVVDDHPSLQSLAAGCHKIMNAIDNKESLTRKEWMGHYEYAFQPRPPPTTISP